MKVAAGIAGAPPKLNASVAAGTGAVANVLLGCEKPDESEGVGDVGSRKGFEMIDGYCSIAMLLGNS